jgi:hypothetical protein
MGRIEDSDLTIQELVLRKWDDEWDERLKAHIQRIVDEIGCTWWDIVMENWTFSWMKSTRSVIELLPDGETICQTDLGGMTPPCPS